MSSDDVRCASRHPSLDLRCDIAGVVHHHRHIAASGPQIVAWRSAQPLECGDDGSRVEDVLAALETQNRAWTARAYSALVQLAMERPNFTTSDLWARLDHPGG